MNATIKLALALLCAPSVVPSNCDRSNAIRWWVGDPCNTPIECMIAAQERAMTTGVVPRNGEHWKLTYEEKRND